MTIVGDADPRVDISTWDLIGDRREAPVKLTVGELAMLVNANSFLIDEDFVERLGAQMMEDGKSADEAMTAMMDWFSAAVKISDSLASTLLDGDRLESTTRMMVTLDQAKAEIADG